MNFVILLMWRMEIQRDIQTQETAMRLTQADKGLTDVCFKTQNPQLCGDCKRKMKLMQDLHKKKMLLNRSDNPAYEYFKY